VVVAWKEECHWVSWIPGRGVSVAEGQGGPCAEEEEVACAQERDSISLPLQPPAQQMDWMRDGNEQVGSPNVAMAAVLRGL
jgi:hypothetical protein